MDTQNTQNNNQYIISEQGDLGLGTRQLTNEEQKLIDEQQKQNRK